ncbi:tropomyosin [Caldibacillus hisashii]|nr:tropomyosin [Caldifermentibacillus hisashii]
MFMIDYYRQYQFPGQGQFLGMDQFQTPGQFPGQGQFQTPGQTGQFFPGFPGTGTQTRIDRLERNVNRLEREVDRLENRLRRVERRLGF